MTEDGLLTRIATVCNYYRGAEWELLFTSSEGGFWSLKLTSPQAEDEQVEAVGPMMRMIYGTTSSYPIFAIRCQELDVVAEALEHWHAGVLAKSGREDVPGV
jgi:hypothetical protein